MGGPGDRSYTVDTAIAALTLPAATRGDGTLSYSLSPEIPGLSFDPMTRRLTGTPTAPGTYAMTYTATDGDGDTDSLSFSIRVAADTSGQTDLGDCEAGLVVRPGQHCAYPGTEEAFTVLDDGRAMFLVITSARAININSVTFRGHFYDFRASHQGEGVWWLDRVEGVTVPPPPPDLSPSFAATAGPGDQNYAQNTAIAPLTLPAATGGDGELSYSLTPEVPGLSFDPATRRLTGTPTEVGNHAMTYTVTDADGDSDSLAFGIEVRAPNMIPEFGPGVAPRDQSYTRGVAITPLLLPAASGGDGTLSYSLTPSIRGLSFDPATRQLTGTPTSSGTRAMTYEVTDADGDTDTLSFSIRVRAPAAPDSSPEFDPGTGPGDQGYTQGTAITPLTLPAATGGDGTLSYSLTPQVPGLSFDPATRRLTGTPTAVGTHAMTYEVTDADGDSDTLSFGIGVELSAVALGDREVLVALYNATDGANWTDNTNWLSTAPLGEWHGVTVDVGGRVTELILRARQLSGTIPVELGRLSSLEKLFLGKNQLSAAIPVELSQLSNLKSLSLSENDLSGAIPIELARLSSLESLNLANNFQLSGTIPVELTQLPSLKHLILSNNQLSGTIPTELARLSNLISLYLNGNQLTGAIPAELGELSNLKYMLLDRNQLSGAIPKELGKLASLEFLSFSDNQVSGAIPAELGKLSELIVLIVIRNQLSGAIPAELGNLSNLETLWLGDNQLSGDIPSALGNLSNLESIFLASNNLTGCIPSGLQDVPINDFHTLGLEFCDDS